MEMLNKTPEPKLRASLSKKLLEFVGDQRHDDDDNVIHDLTEYIIVLISNGKNQNQVKNDLEEFLGERSEEFVSWVWDFLSENAQDSNGTLLGSSDKEKATVLNASDAIKQKCKTYPYSSRDEEVSEGNQHHHAVFLHNLDDEFVENEPSKTRKFIKKHEASENIQIESLNCCSSRVTVFGGAEQSMQYKKVDKRSAHFRDSDEVNVAGKRLFSWAAGTGSPHFRDSDEVNVAGRRLFSRAAGAGSPHFRDSDEVNVAGRRLFSRAAGAILHQHARLHGNVWDRLGRLSEDRSSGAVNIKRQIFNHDRLFPEKNRSLHPVRDHKFHRRLSENSDTKIEASNGGRKRQFNEDAYQSTSVSDPTHDDESSKKIRRWLPEKDNNVVTENSVSSGPESLKSQKISQASGSDVSTSSRSNKMFQSGEALQSPDTMISKSTPLTAKPDSIDNSEGATVNLTPMQAQLMEMRSKLHQIESEILKLQSKQVDNKNQNHDLSSSSGKGNSCKMHSSMCSSNHPTGVESRTVFVTNVHIAATREALKSYFEKCGAVDKVIKLTDTDIANQKASAYITFINKSSADKALALSGKLFFAQIIWVRKAGKLPQNSVFNCRGGRRNTDRLL